MLNFSFSSVFIAILGCNILLIFLALLLQNQNIMLRMGFKLIQIFIVLTIFRFLFPLELPFTINIYYPETISELLSIFLYKKFSLLGITFYIWNILEVIWGIGFLIHLFQYLKTKYSLYRFIQKHGTKVNSEEPYASLLPKICQEKNIHKTIHIIKLPMIQSPMVSKFLTYYICIPENLCLDTTELTYTLCHETSHIKHHDLMVKTLIQMICMIYWWNPFCYLLKKQTDLLCELRVDQSVINNQKEKGAYLRCLIKVMEQIENEPSIHKYNGISLSSKSKTVMQKRFNFIIQSESAKPHPFLKLLLIPICVIYLFSLIFIFEPSSVDPETERTTDELSSNMTYMIQKSDGTYDVYYNGIFLENTDSLEYYPEDCKIYNSEQEALEQLKHEQ